MKLTGVSDETWYQKLFGDIFIYFSTETYDVILFEPPFRDKFNEGSQYLFLLLKNATSYLWIILSRALNYLKWPFNIGKWCKDFEHCTSFKSQSFALHFPGSILLLWCVKAVRKILLPTFYLPIPSFHLHFFQQIRYLNGAIYSSVSQSWLIVII